MDPPDLAEHGPEGQTESDGEEPRAQVAGDRKHGRGHEAAVEAPGYDGQEAAHDAQEHEVVAGRVRVLNDPAVGIAEVEVDEASGQHATYYHDGDDGRVDPQRHGPQLGLDEGLVLRGFVGRPQHLVGPFAVFRLLPEEVVLGLVVSGHGDVLAVLQLLQLGQGDPVAGVLVEDHGAGHALEPHVAHLLQDDVADRLVLEVVVLDGLAHQGQSPHGLVEGQGHGPNRVVGQGGLKVALGQRRAREQALVQQNALQLGVKLLNVLQFHLMNVEKRYLMLFLIENL